MARIILCDAEDGRVAAYMVSDHEAGTTTAWCAEHFADLCASVTRAAEEAIAADRTPVTPQVVDDVVDEAPAVVDVQLPDDTVSPGPLALAARDEFLEKNTAREMAARERTRRKLADRPDSAATSLDVVPEPGPPRR
jgi:hypothetical protein